MSVKISTKAVELARIAAATRGEKLSEYCSRVLAQHADADIEEFQQRRRAEAEPTPPAAKKSTRPRKDGET